MLLTKLEAQGFRSLKQVKINFDQLTLLIGGNDAGKSSVLDLLDIVLTSKTPDSDDFYRASEKDEPVAAIEAVLEFRLDREKDEEALQYALDGILRIRRVYTLDGEKTYYWNQYPEDERLRRDDFKGLSAAKQKELIREVEPQALEDLDLSNSEKRTKWWNAYAESTPQTQGWKEAPQRGWGSFLPRFYRYSAMDYDDPGNMILDTLRQVFNSVVYEDEENQQLTAELKEVRDRAQTAINEKVAELLSYIKKYNDQVQSISYDPIIDFSRGLRAGQFQIDDGRGFHYLSKTGDGTKRRMFIATVDWDRDVTLEQAAQDAVLPPVIRGYDEPDTNLDYGAQRTMCRAISSIVQEEKARTQAILCTHSPPMINRVPAQHIRLLSLCDGCTQIEQLEVDGDPEVEAFLCESAQELGITNTLMFYERCFVLIEGETEENALPILYRNIYGHSLLEDGIRPINVQSNGAVKEFLKLLGLNRQELTVVFVDADTRNSQEAKLTEEVLRSAGFNDEFIAGRLLYIGHQEFEDAFSDEAIARCLQDGWPKSSGEWGPEDITPLREEKKFSKALRKLVWKNTTPDMARWSKPIFGRALARCCSGGEIPRGVYRLFEIARTVAKCD